MIIADWTKETAYPFKALKPKERLKDLPKGTKLTTDREWKWEFLRRNKIYQEAHADFLKTAEQNKSERYPDPPKLPWETREVWMCRCDNMGIMAKMLSWEQQCAKQWGLLNRMGDPSQGITPHIRFACPDFPKCITSIEAAENVFCDQPVGSPVGVEMDEAQDTVLMVDPNRMLIAFDLTLPVQPQVMRLRKLLSHAKKERNLKVDDAPHNRRHLWAKYLRALDGYDAGVNKATIGKILGFNEGGASASAQAYDWLKTAEYLRETGYRFIGSE